MGLVLISIISLVSARVVVDINRVFLSATLGQTGCRSGACGRHRIGCFFIIIIIVIIIIIIIVFFSLTSLWMCQVTQEMMTQAHTAPNTWPLPPQHWPCCCGCLLAGWLAGFIQILQVFYRAKACCVILAANAIATPSPQQQQQLSSYEPRVYHFFLS